jgi:hypothetical protein
VPWMLLIACDASTSPSHTGAFPDVDASAAQALHDAYCARVYACAGTAPFCGAFTATGTEGTPDCVVQEGEDLEPCLAAIAAASCDDLGGGLYRPEACALLCAD